MRVLVSFGKDHNWVSLAKETYVHTLLRLFLKRKLTMYHQVSFCKEVKTPIDIGQETHDGSGWLNTLLLGTLYFVQLCCLCCYFVVFIPK